ncbi:macB-like periplasmic core domain protein [Streptococcus intermedius BA1]|nr:MacB-like periplasmic core domain protein [Streptococcus intermedius]EKU17443.1 macB-like periplasmic core domain protein [Streptococcus intermedius BA1]
MKKSILKKDIWLSFRQSKGRFLSIMCLMMLGSFALVGLKAASPDIENSAHRYLVKMKLMDLAVISDYGISQDDQKELDTLKHARVEYGYFKDTVIEDSSTSVRVFSQTNKISRFHLVSGEFPRNENQIALASFYQRKYKIGDSITLNEEGSNKSVLKQHTFTVTGFVNSSELASTISLGESTSGSGSLSAYAVVSPKTFKSSVYTVARVIYEDLTNLNSFGDIYRKKLKIHQNDLKKMLADNGKNRLSTIKSEAQKKITEGEAIIKKTQQTLADAQKQLTAGQRTIDQKKAELQEVQNQLLEKESRLAQGATQIAQAEQTLDKSKIQLNTAADQLTAGWIQLNQNKAHLDSANNQLTADKEKLTSSQAKLSAAQTGLEQGQAQLASAKIALQEKIGQLKDQGIDPSTVAEIVAAQAQIAKKEAELNVAKTELANQQAIYRAALAQYQQQEQAYQVGNHQYQAALATLKQKQSEYDVGKAQYQSGLTVLESKKRNIRQDKYN